MSNIFSNKTIKFLDLFAGAGGLSEGFIRASFNPIAHIEIDEAACFTLKTRLAYHWFKKSDQIHIYNKYLHGNITRKELYDFVPNDIIESVINTEIGERNLKNIFREIDAILDGYPLDLIVGGPPCQAYSLVGRSRDKNRMHNDKRNFLYVYYAKFLERYKPKYFVFENVMGLLSAKTPEGIRYFDSMRNVFKDVGYETEYRILSADDYGVMQSRKRIILVGRKGKRTGFFPEPDRWFPGETVSEVLCDLPFLQAGSGAALPCEMKTYTGKYLYTAKIRSDSTPVTWHIARPHTDQDKEIYRIAVNKWNDQRERLKYNDLPKRLKTHKNQKSFTDRFKIVANDLHAAQTIVAHISKDGHYYIHPDINQNRSITPREAARLQTFPDNYYFESMSGIAGRTSAFHQIGNAVPVLLAEKIATRLLESWI